MAEEIEVILAKYSTQESSINERLIKKKEEKIQKHSEFKKERREKREKNMEIATLRNKEIIQNLEATKGYLRSKSIFSPSEMVFTDICRRYKESPSLQVSTWRCNLRTFV
nr:uncharacterized protein LOC111426761 isoform X1 [Onthophagus taurus]